MTIEESRNKIEQEFINRYYEFLKDVNEKEENNRDFGWKYGWVLTDSMKKKFSKDTQANMIWFHGHIFSGRWLPQWEKAGYDRKILSELHRIGFLSYKYYSNWNARATGKENLYFISQATAKEIYKFHKAQNVQ